ncbi:hypothetical protein [Pseudomonas sp.]|nr:hypothetical protein [Pseudomonas sp.]
MITSPSVCEPLYFIDSDVHLGNSLNRCPLLPRRVYSSQSFTHGGRAI